MQKIEFKNLPSTDTPITAENLNAIQSNIENEINDSSVVVSATEPTTDRKKIWIQKGKNLFDKNNANILNAATSGDTGKIVANNNKMRLVYIPCKPNTIYTSQKIQGQNNNLSYTKELPQIGTEFYGRVLNSTGTTCTITTGADAKFLVLVLINLKIETSLTLQQVLNSIQIEQNSVATEYEPYVEPKIYIKNDNDVYEEFTKDVKYERIELSDFITLNTGFSILYDRIFKHENHYSGYITIKKDSDFTGGDEELGTLKVQSRYLEVFYGVTASSEWQIPAGFAAACIETDSKKFKIKGDKTAGRYLKFYIDIVTN